MSSSENLTASEHSTPYTEMPQTQPTTLNSSQHHPITNPYQQCSHHHQTCQQLTQWLWQSQTQTTTPTTPDRTTPHITHQPLLHPSKENKLWGDQVNPTPPTNHLHIMAKNLNTVNIDNDYLQWQALIQATWDTSTSMLCIQKTNLQWNSRITHKIGQIIRTMPFKLFWTPPRSYFSTSGAYYHQPQISLRSH